ncbi:MAG: low affinity iron permease family protein [Candidatus Manganitrophaceae bacterium]|nr:MAG: low affinity iron permease family protein [Candidatus Manganitrophaceae bacterium]
MKQRNHQRHGSSGEGQQRLTLREFFRKFAHQIAEAVGSPGAFLSAVAIIIVWAFSGPVFHFSDTWQLIINTGTTIITFLMVFLIQNTQNRDSRAVHLKLDELIRSVQGARNWMIDLEDLSDEEIEAFRKEFQRFTKQSRERKAARG